MEELLKRQVELWTCCDITTRLLIFIIPHHAMSAGTLLALSGNDIWMDYYSVLGPIDPQVPNLDQTRLIPAIGRLIRYEELLDRANNGEAGPAELRILFGFDQGDLYSYQQARELSVSLLVEWLVKYKFSTWEKTETRRVDVTLRMKKERAKKIAEKLNDVQKWNSHGIGISRSVLEEELKLKISDYTNNETLMKNVRNYRSLLTDYMTRVQMERAVHTSESFTGDQT